MIQKYLLLWATTTRGISWKIYGDSEDDRTELAKDLAILTNPQCLYVQVFMNCTEHIQRQLVQEQRDRLPQKPEA